ncbi:MAG: rhomboid family intramembrane serine protease [Candidatus Hydrogenedentota bacterium]|nr:MAG: rhomboid family intramembrane serine protease [Candidatus Hydrogenedentota bacterium]
MLPLRDTAPIYRTPWVTWFLIFINLVVFLFEISLPPDVLNHLLYYFALIPRSISDPDWAMAHGMDPKPYFTFYTNTFLHGSFFHIFSNMWTLWIFGDNVESKMGHGRFFLFYSLCGVLASITHYSLYSDSTVPALGASGAISGVMGAYMLLFPLSRIIFLVPIFIFPFFFEWPALVFIGFWFFMQFFYGTTTFLLGDHATNIAFWAHIGGFVAGIILYRFFLIGAQQFHYPEQYYRRYTGGI